MKKLKQVQYIVPYQLLVWLYNLWWYICHVCLGKLWHMQKHIIWENTVVFVIIKWRYTVAINYAHQQSLHSAPPRFYTRMYSRGCFQSNVDIFTYKFKYNYFDISCMVCWPVLFTPNINIEKIHIEFSIITLWSWVLSIDTNCAWLIRYK